MPTLKKLLSKFSRENRVTLEHLIDRISFLSWDNLDIKKLKVYQDIFRLRKGKLRIIFIKTGKNISIINIERRKETTYKLQSLEDF